MTELTEVGPLLARAILDMRFKAVTRGATWEPTGFKKVMVSGMCETVTLFASEYGEAGKRFDERFTDEERAAILHAARRR